MNELKKKLEQIKKLLQIIQLNGGKPLTAGQKQEIDNTQYSLEFNLKNLVDECKIREADEKIKAFSKVIDIIKQNYVQPTKKIK